MAQASKFIFSLLVAVSITLCLSGLTLADDCSQYQTCSDCLGLNTTDTGDMTSFGNRPYCGWCHANIVLQNGTTGTRCADIRTQWKCPSAFDTYTCTTGWECDYSTGQCHQASPGEGYPTDATCQEHCFKTPDTYKCNTTSYQCEKCSQGDPHCADKSTACANCQQPQGRFKCDRSNSTNPQCTFCSPTEAGCSDFKSACSNCTSPPPPPPPSPPTPPPPSPPQANYTCDVSTLTCKQATTGEPIVACSAKCSNSTPTDLVGNWRGNAAQHFFKIGEYDLLFGKQNVTMREPSGQVSQGSVMVHNGIIIKWTSGPYAGSTWGAVKAELTYGPETLTIGLGLNPNGDAPESFEAAMAGNGMYALVLSSCHQWTQQCKFNPPAQLNHLRRSVPEQTKLITPFVNHPADPCNQFTDCKMCVSVHPDFNCGWCMGGNIVYNDTGDSGKRCGGFVHGQPLPFTCVKDFRTENCAGYSCNYTASEPSCMYDENGQFSDLSKCQQTCKPAEMAKCNLETKQCEPCTMGQPNCTTTQAECAATCNVQHQKCNTETKQCESCDPAHDPDCHDTAGECQRTCAKENYGICDPLKGQCIPCQPSQTGCVQNCNDTCTVEKNFYCDEQNLQCMIGKGNMTLNQCAEVCRNATAPTYGCVWNGSHPMCVENQGSLSKQECDMNCKVPDYAKCNFTTGQCQVCQPSVDPDCIYTESYCNASCRPSTLGGIYRGIAINNGYAVGEWDFTVHADEVLSFWLNDANKYEYQGSVITSANEAVNGDGAPLTITLTHVPSASDAPLSGATVGSKLSGIYVTHKSEDSVFQFLFLSFSGPNGTPVTTFADGMSSFEFVLFACDNSGSSTVGKNCDFSSAAVPEMSGRKGGLRKSMFGYSPKKASYFERFYNRRV